ncbi:MAG: hypothetical protein WD995_13640 [Gemmatimonadota bacterium]
MMQLRTGLAAIALLAAPFAVEAQSIFNSAGLGRPVDAVDARARSLGSLGIGLQGGYLSPADPAAAGRLGFASAVMVTQPSWVEASRDGTPVGDFRGTRFPLMGVAYPVLSGMATVQLGSYLDQRFAGQRVVSVDLGGTSHDVIDDFTQEGGVSSASFGFARMVGSDVSVGLNVARYTGSVIRELARSFEGLDLEGTQSFTSSGFWSYSGTSVTAGATADVGSVGRLAASVRWSSALDADASEGTLGGSRSFDMPLEIRVGGSAVLMPGLILAASAVHADWADIQDDLAVATGVGDTSGFGVGMELAQVRFLGRSAPLRFGYRYNGLPFALGTEGTGSEKTFSGGMGFAFNETNGVLLAAADLALERGERSAGTLSERFWRLTATIRVAGF